MEKPKKADRPKQPHAWRGVWNRPLKVDEDSLDALTVARMTNHNVRGSDEDEKNEEERGAYHAPPAKPKKDAA